MNKKLQNLLLALFAVSFLTIPGHLLAQGSLADVWVMTVKPANQQAFEEAFKEHAAYRKEQGEAFEWDVYTPVTGESFDMYVIQACCFSWADLDKREAWEADTPEITQNWATTAAQYVENYAHFYDDYDMSNSHWPEGGNSPPYVGVTDYFIKPGHGSKFAAAKAKLSQIAINQGWAQEHHWAWSNRVGGSPTVSIVVPFDSFADMADDEVSFAEFLTQHMGAEGAEEVFSDVSGAIAGSSYTIWRHRADLNQGNDD
jgi:hypothetical protein